MSTKQDVIEYLASVGIDANLVPQDGYDETGYDVYVTAENGLPIYGNVGASKSIKRERKTWPDYRVYPLLQDILAGRVDDWRAKVAEYAASDATHAQVTATVAKIKEDAEARLEVDKEALEAAQSKVVPAPKKAPAK